MIRMRVFLAVLAVGVGLCASLSAQTYPKDDKALVDERDRLAKTGNKDAAAKLEAWVADKSAPAIVRINGALGLERMSTESGGGVGASEMARYTGDGNPAVRYLAYKTLLSRAANHPKAGALAAEAVKDKDAPIRLLAVKYFAERKENPRALAEVIVKAGEDREVREQAEVAFKEITGQDFGFVTAVKRDPNSPKGVAPDEEKEKAAVAKYEEWLKKK